MNSDLPRDRVVTSPLLIYLHAFQCLEGPIKYFLHCGKDSLVRAPASNKNIELP